MSDVSETSETDYLTEEMDADTHLPATSWKVAGLAAGLISSGLLTNVAFELLSKSESGCTSLLTLAQYAVALLAQLREAPKHLSSPAIPLRVHVCFCALMFGTAFCGNRSVDYNLPFPIYLTIKSSNLVASMLVGVASGKRYSRGQCFGCLAMTAGVILATLVAKRGPAGGGGAGGGGGGGGAAAAAAGGGISAAASSSLDASLLFGASLCALSTLCMAMLGVVQERSFARYGQHHAEAIFYIHALGLAPLLCLQSGGEAPLARLRRWIADGAVHVWGLTLLNLAACQLCKRCFFGLLGATSSLSASLGVLTYRFLGVLLSALYFNAPPFPPVLMLVGVVLVTMGGLAYLSNSAAPAPKRSD